MLYEILKPSFSKKFKLCSSLLTNNNQVLDYYIINNIANNDFKSNHYSTLKRELLDFIKQINKILKISNFGKSIIPLL